MRFSQKIVTFVAMNIVLINRSDHLGGAAIASRRLMHALAEQGIDVRMLVIDSDGEDRDHVAVVGGKWQNRYNFLAERLGIFLRNGMNRDTLFKIDNASHGVDLSRHAWVKTADVIILNWINQGMMSFKGLKRLLSMGKPVVWTMHDMWNCTGVCHHAYECLNYETLCHDCPLTGKRGNDLSTSVQATKARLYQSPNLHFVAVSNWLAQCCSNSSLMGGKWVRVIGNPFPTSTFTCDYERSMHTANHDACVIAMGAARLDDPVKGFDLLIDAMQHLATNKPDVASKIHLLLYGALRDESLLERIAVPYTHLGYVDDVREVYRQSHVVLSTSRYESFGYTLLEGMACGCVPVTTGSGGQVDIVKHLTNGYVAMQDAASIAQGIEWAMNCGLTREQLHEWVAVHFDASIIAGQYLDMINNL